MVGMYKCGTSWLLHMLAAHPQVLGWREFDPLRATYAPLRSKRSLALTALDYLRPRPANNAWMQRREASVLREPPEIFREMFAGRGWMPLMGAQNQRRAENLDPQNLDTMLDELLTLGSYTLRGSSAPALDPADFTQRLGVQSFRRDDLLTLMQTVRDARHAPTIPRLFFDSLRSQALPGTRIATKAADQLLQLTALKDASPGSRAIAIVRDGRDAAVSARHFEALMRKREAPWRTAQASYVRRLFGWSMRAAKLAEHARRGEITVLRYEDLHAAFPAVCRALFLNLNLAADDRVINAVKNATDFKTVTQGRQSGHSAEHQIRKGSVGDWQDALSRSQANLAWHVAGPSLKAFGYTRSGTLQPSPLVLAA